MNTMNFCGSVESLQSKRTSLQGSPCRPVGRELTDELAATLSAHLPPKPRARGSPRSGSSGAGWARLLAFAGRAKRAERRLAERTASANRLRYGRSKAERELEAKRDVKARHDLDRHRIETGDE